jgi:hypothetical protein
MVKENVINDLLLMEHSEMTNYSQLMLLNLVDSINKTIILYFNCLLIHKLTLIANKYLPTSLITARENSFGKAGVSRRGTL